MSDFPTLAEVERQHIARALELTNGNVTEAATLLGVSRSSLYRWRLQHSGPTQRRQLMPGNAEALASLAAFQSALHAATNGGAP